LITILRCCLQVWVGHKESSLISTAIWICLLICFGRYSIFFRLQSWASYHIYTTKYHLVHTFLVVYIDDHLCKEVINSCPFFFYASASQHVATLSFNFSMYLIKTQSTTCYWAPTASTMQLLHNPSSCTSLVSLQLLDAQHCVITPSFKIHLFVYVGRFEGSWRDTLCLEGNNTNGIFYLYVKCLNQRG
jgi:hypothetical protein